MAAVLSLAGAASCPGAARSDEPAAPPLVFEHWRALTPRDGLPHEEILAIRLHEGRVWVGTARGLALHDGDTWTSWSEDDGLPWPEISAIDVDPRTRDVWLGTWGGGLIRFSGGCFDRFDQLNSGLAGNLVFAVAIADDRVWAATNGGLSALDPVEGTWDLQFERRADMPETALTGFARDDGDLYAAAWCEGPLRFDPKRWTWAPVAGAAGASRALVPASGPATGVLAIAARAGTLWWATPDTLMRRDGAARGAGGGETRALPERLPERPGSGGLVHCLAATDDAVVALGTDEGLLLLADWETATWVGYRAVGAGSAGGVTWSRGGRTLDIRSSASSIPDDRVRCVAFGRDDIWVGTLGGLAHGTGRHPWVRGSVAPNRTVPDPGASGTPASVRTAAEAAEEPGAVGIGILRSGNRTITVPGSGAGAPGSSPLDMMAVRLAVELANGPGGFRGRIPFAAATGPTGSFSGWGWTTPEDDFPALAKKSGVCGIVGQLGPEKRLRSAVALRTEVPLVNVGAEPATGDEIMNPWIFRCRGDDPQRHRLVLDYVFDHLGCVRVAVLRGPERVEQLRLDWWAEHARRRGHPPVADLRCDAGDADLEARLRSIRRAGAEVVLTARDASGSAALLRAMRREGMHQLFVGGAEIIGEAFVTGAGPDPGSVIAVGPRTSTPRRQADARFVSRYTARFGRPPSQDAFFHFEATGHLLAAIESAGLDREAVRGTLQRMSRDPDAEAHCEQVPYAADAILLGRLQGGRWELLTPADLGIESP